MVLGWTGPTLGALRYQLRREHGIKVLSRTAQASRGRRHLTYAPRRARRSEPMAREAEPAALALPFAERRHCGHHLAGDEPRLVGEIIDDPERLGDALGGIDEDRHHRHVAAE